MPATVFGAPGVMVVAVKMLPVSAVKVPLPLMLNWVEIIVSAKAGEAAIKAAQATAARSAWREFTTLMTAFLCGYFSTKHLTSQHSFFNPQL
jgi:hypothetical protein